MSSYERPSIDAPVFRNADGEVIDYGSRWGGMPPEDTYSVDTHPERFAPLHTIADALIAHLREAYDVEVDEGAEVAGDLLRPSYHGVIRAVRMRPKDPTAPALTFVFTGYPGIYLHVGLLHDFPFPICGCDACDSTWQAEAEELERDVFAVITGNFRETIERGLRPWVEYAFTYPDGASSGRSRSQDLPTERFAAARVALRELPDGWRAWPRSPSDL